MWWKHTRPNYHRWCAHFCTVHSLNWKTKTKTSTISIHQVDSRNKILPARTMICISFCCWYYLFSRQCRDNNKLGNPRYAVFIMAHEKTLTHSLWREDLWLCSHSMPSPLANWIVCRQRPILAYPSFAWKCGMWLWTVRIGFCEWNED